MKKIFVLDENILYFASSGTNEKGEDDNTCTELIRDIVQQCHKIILDSKLQEIYLQDLNKLKSGKVINEIVLLLVQLLKNSDKYIFYPNDPSCLSDKELGYLPINDDHDIYMVRSAKERDVPLITKDGRLLEKIEKAKENGFFSKVQALSPEKIIWNKQKGD
ncbi:hypothetical protein HY793_04745 [Candidatus Desantisbacteria bacterium]|nr:hypothetical protein [Candidatus Desantisbacteria bacterium]